FYDKAKSTFSIRDLRFASAARGVAIGNILEGNHRKWASVVTSDGGAHWQLNPLEEQPLSLFFLNENAGWMVTTHGLWRTDEAGKSWHRVHHFPPGMWVVHFLDERNGIAAGAKKAVFQTHDGGEHWAAVAAASEPPGDAKFSA